MNWLAYILHRLGRNSEAEITQRQILKLYEKAMGQENLHTFGCMSNFGAVLRGQGRYLEAEVICRQVLELREKVLGQEHPYMVKSRNNLAVYLRAKGTGH